MRKRWIVLLSAFLVLCLAGGFVAWFVSPKYRINRQGYDEIAFAMDSRGEAGFLRSEVEEILGPQTNGRIIWRHGDGAIWQSNQFRIVIYFDEQGRAIQILKDEDAEPESIIDKMWHRLIYRGSPETNVAR